MDSRRIKSQLKKIAEDFKLKYEPTWFKHLWIPKKYEILTEYVGNCPDPIYEKYGKTVSKRITNIGIFLRSKDFSNCLKRYGGQVIHKRDWERDLKLLKNIKDEGIKKELLKFYTRIKADFQKTTFITLLSKPKNKKEREWQMKFCLRHEWIHVLLYQNRIIFQNIKKSYWTYDEGINEYLASYIDGSLDKLERFGDKEDYPLEKKYWIYAIKFRTLFQDKTTAIERKKAIQDLLKTLKKKK